MSLKPLNQSAFTAVEGILILVIVAIIGGTGFFVYDASKKANNTLTSAAKVAQSTPSKTGSSVQTIALDSSVHLVTFTKLPSNLQKAVITHASCVANGQLTNEDGSAATAANNTYVANKAAFIAECQTKALYTYTSGNWQFVSQTQFGFNCSDLQKSNVSTALAIPSLPNDQCLDANNNFVHYQP
jgi:hypothetical protein